MKERKNDMIQKENVIIIKKGKQSGTIENYTSGLQKYSRISVKKHSSNFMADPSSYGSHTTILKSRTELELFGSLRLKDPDR